MNPVCICPLPWHNVYVFLHVFAIGVGILYGLSPVAPTRSFDHDDNLVNYKSRDIGCNNVASARVIDRVSFTVLESSH